VFIGAIIAGCSYMIMWQVYESNSEMYNFLYFLGWSCVFWIGMTIFGVPFVAMGYEMSDDFHERTRIMAVSQWIGQWAWVIVPWFWVILDPSFGWFESMSAGARDLSLWVGAGCMLLAIVPAIFCTHTTNDGTNQQQDEKKSLTESMKDFGRGIVVTLSNKPFQKICIATFFIFNAFNIVASFSYFIISHYVQVSIIWVAAYGAASALCTTFIVIPIINYLSQIYGKKLTFLCSQAISILGYILLWWGFSPEIPWLMFLPLPLFACGIGGLFTLMMSMTADVCDLDDLETSKRREGTFAAIYWWMVKFGGAFGGLATGAILSFIGYDGGAAVHSESTLDLMRLSYIIVPCIGTILAILIMRNYDLDETKANQIRSELEARKSGQASA
jgi:GPH family glycoside/pentoside/hexuronide:cation symporter